jgi:spermidine synthase
LRDRTFWPVVTCFLLSGFAALIYQTAWTREFAFVFGTSELAVATVLAAYMGGLALGAWVASRFVRRVQRPVRVYGLLEAGIALAAIAVPFAIRGATALYVALLGGQPDLPPSDGAGHALYFLASSFAILLVPTALMGATLPLLARHAVHTRRQIGSRIGALYATNTAGAVAGTLCAAFWLLPAYGLRATVAVAVAANVLVFAIAALVARSAPPAEPEPDGAAPAARPFHWILPAILLSGAVSFAYEVFWFRLLGHVLGGSVHAFSTMLASFLIGIALGSAAAARAATDGDRALRGFALVQLGIAALSVLAYLALDRVPGAAIAVLLPSTLCIGATFPFAVRILARDPEDASVATARVYAWNTIGAIAGSLGAGFFLIPWLGFPGMLAVAVGASASLALAAALLERPRAVALAAAAAIALAGAALVRLSPPWNLLRTGPVAQMLQPGEVIFHSVGRTATVLLVDEGTQWALRTNGLPESSIGAANSRTMKYGSSRWLGLMPTLARPETRDMLVIGLGGGVAIERIAPTVERVDVIEIEPEVIAANRRLAGLRRFDPLADPRVILHVNDARGALELSELRYDAIVSQPSHPWTAGASHLYTREFFQLAKRHLRPGGVLVQWMGTNFVDEALFRSLLATISETFPYLRVYLPYAAGEFLFLASDQPLDVEASSLRAMTASPEFFHPLGMESAEDVAASLILDEEAARRWGQGAPISTDDYNLLQTRSPRVTLTSHGLEPSTIAAGLGADDALLVVARTLDPIALAQASLAQTELVRVQRLAESVKSPLQRQVITGLVALATGQAAPASQAFTAALELSPNQPVARAGLLRLRRKAFERSPDAIATLLPLAPDEKAVVDGWAAGEGAAAIPILRAMDARLAEVGPRSPLHLDALRMRARWRIEEGGAANVTQALEYLDRAIQLGARPDDYLRRARAMLALGDPSEAVESIDQILRWVERSPAARPIAVEALALLDGISVGEDDARFLTRVRARLAKAMAHPARVGEGDAARGSAGRAG